MQGSPTGVAGLDVVLCGGFPSGRTTVITGGPGCGKTVLALQFLIAGAATYGEPGLMISFEESPDALHRNWRAMRWPSAETVGHSVQIVDGRLPNDVVETGTFDLGGLVAVLASLVETHGVKRLAVDGIDALFSLGTNAPTRRQEILRVLEWLNASDVTGLLTMKAESNVSGIPAHFSFADFAADGVVQLQSTMHDELLRRTLRVIKLRGTDFLGGDHPYTISAYGLRVMTSPKRTLMANTNSLARRLSTGVERLDRMLGGGLRAGTVTLLSGLPGTSKTTFAASFLWAGCNAGERVQFIGFDEPSEQMIYDAGSVGIRLDGARAAGLLRCDSFAAGSAIGDEHYLAIEALIDEHAPARVVIDPITALAKAGGPDIADIVSERLAVLFKSRGITGLLTAVSDSRSGELESTPSRVSTIADTWIHLSFAAAHGERNRTLTIVKARGTAHSNQMREVLVSDNGVTLADVFTGGGDVLLGTARLRYEQEAALAALLAEQRSLLEIRTLDEQREHLAKELEDLRHRIDALDAQRADILHRTRAGDTTARAAAQAVRAARFADPPAPSAPGVEIR